MVNKTPLPALYPNDVVTAGDFPIVVQHVSGGNGTFSGDGFVTLPFINKFKEKMGGTIDANSDQNVGIRITFNNIGVNTDFKLISGEIAASYDPNWGSMVDGNEVVNAIVGDTGAVDPIFIPFEIKSVIKNADGTLTITGTNGTVVTQPKTADDIIITDKEGKQYAVSPNAPAGEIKQTGKAAPGGVPTPQNTNGMGSGGNIREISSSDVSITFTAGTGFYSLDENPNQDPKLKANTKLNDTYDVIPKKDGTSYYVNYKAVSDVPNAKDYVTANATFSNGKTKDDIVFKTQNGTEIPSTWSGNVATLELKRTLDFAKESILATVKPPTQKDSVKVTAKYDIAGTLNMWHLANKKINVTLVGLNGGKTPTQSEAQKYLNSIYGKAGIQFEVNTITADIEDSWGAGIETGDSDLLNTYSNGQLKINSDFQAQLGSDYKNDTYYVFFTKVPSGKQGTLGFMPLKRQFGYVFTPTSEAGGLRTLAHELGHGIFGLQHPFAKYNTTAVTDLLMDYGTGTVLSHNDWEIMHAPGLQLYQFTQGDSEGELFPPWYIITLLKELKHARQTNIIYTFKSPTKGYSRVLNNVILNGNNFEKIHFQISPNTKQVDVSKIKEYKKTDSDGTLLVGLEIDSQIIITVKKDEFPKLEEYFESTKPENFILFVNGYDPAKISDDKNQVFEYDKINYWGAIDDKFVNAINNKSHLIYADGNKDINTSNHINTYNFGLSLASVTHGTAPYHNKTPNVAGFESRKADGKSAGRNFINKLKDGTINCSKTIKNGKITVHGVVDIVAHSMGFAYSLGMIEELQKEGIEIGNYYVIAPENACSGTIPPSMSNKTWQYGSDERTTKENPIEIQDGVAPQCAIKGIDPLMRVYIPIKERSSKQLGFTESHSIANYDWIFDEKIIRKGRKGYVEPRNMTK